MPASKFGPLANYIDLLLDTVCVIDITGRVVYISAGCERVFGFTQEELVNTIITTHLHPDDVEITEKVTQEVLQGKQTPHFENRYIRKDGSIAHIMWSVRWSAEDRLRIAVARDITRRVQSEAKQRATYAISEAAHTTNDLTELFGHIHKIVSDLIPVDSFSIVLLDAPVGTSLNPDNISPENLAYAQPELCAQGIDPRLQLTGQMIDTRSNLLVHVQSDLAGIVNWIGVPLRAHKRLLGALLVSRNDSQNTFSALDQELIHFVGTQIAAAVERQRMLHRLQQLALYDSLTQLPNRTLLEDRMQSAMARARRDQTNLALLYIDLDRFKEVNDNYGHAIGDLLLQQVARRLDACLRECDTVARLGGDEFVILLENLEQDDHVGKVADKVTDVLSQPFVLMSHRISITPSLGAAHYPVHGSDIKSLVHHADMQMYSAKRQSASQR